MEDNFNATQASDGEVPYNPYDIGTPQHVVYSSAIKHLSGATEARPIGVEDIIKKIEDDIQGKFEFSPKNIYYTILRASKDELSPIGSKKGKGGGYFIKTNLSDAGDYYVEKEEDERIISNKILTQEKHIWPLFADWFRVVKKHHRVSYRIANLKKGGIWSNPDIVALNIVDDLGFFDIEIITAEVKPSSQSWRYFFFEAVSHRRFSERSYYMFRGSRNDSALEEMMLYAEKCGIGIVIVDLNDDEYNEIVDWDNFTQNKKIQFVDRVDEIIPAQYGPISPRDKVEYLRRVNIKDRRSIYEFGINESNLNLEDE